MILRSSVQTPEDENMVCNMSYLENSGSCHISTRVDGPEFVGRRMLSEREAQSAG